MTYEIITYTRDEYPDYTTLGKGSYQQCLDKLLCLYTAHRDTGNPVHINRLDSDNIVSFSVNSTVIEINPL